jgi:hypothetical protein
MFGAEGSRGMTVQRLDDSLEFPRFFHIKPANPAAVRTADDARDETAEMTISDRKNHTKGTAER